jgi:prepilin-type processing-associated H-X9-DG protein
MVVVAVIAMLIAILLPVLKTARQRAMAVQCQSNLRQIGMAFFSYATDNHDYMPGIGYAAVALNGTPGETFIHVLGKSGYLGKMQTFRGPIFGFTQTRFAVGKCPADNAGTVPDGYWNNELFGASYIMNWSISWYNYYPGYQPPALTYKCWRKGFLKGPTYVAAPTYRKPKPGESKLVIDTINWGVGWVLPYFEWNFDNAFTGPTDPKLYAFRHPGQTLNALYMDGHVQALAPYSKTQDHIWQVLYPDP